MSSEAIINSIAEIIYLTPQHRVELSNYSDSVLSIGLTTLKSKEGKLSNPLSYLFGVCKKQQEKQEKQRIPKQACVSSSKFWVSPVEPVRSLDEMKEELRKWDHNLATIQTIKPLMDLGWVCRNKLADQIKELEPNTETTVMDTKPLFSVEEQKLIDIVQSQLYLLPDLEKSAAPWLKEKIALGPSIDLTRALNYIKKQIDKLFD